LQLVVLIFVMQIVALANGKAFLFEPVTRRKKYGILWVTW